MQGMQGTNASPIKPLTGRGVSIIIVTYNSGAVLPGLLDSVPAGLEGIEKFETIVVDNDSRDDGVQIALAHAVRPRVIRMGRNAGYAAAINAAAATAPADADILILNPDLRLLPGSVKLLVDRLADSSIGVAVPRMLAEDGTTSWSMRREPSLVTAWTDAILGGTLAARIGQSEMIGDSAAYNREGLVEWATGAAVAVAARARCVVGDWDESFFLYSEEVDYMRRVRERGFSLVYIPQAQVVHIGREYRANPRLSALMTANRIRYYGRHHGRLPTALFRLSVIIGETMRAILGPGHRAALWAALTPWKPPPETQSHHSVRIERMDAQQPRCNSAQSGAAIGVKRS
jgi:N-acetylglucosaminyl-diphospho-decaprenol L-rhamnosyltransferase